MPGEIPPLPLAMASQITSTSALLRTIADWDEESQDIYQVVATAFKVGAVYLYCIKDLQAIGITPKSYINSLDKIIDSFPDDSDLRRRCIRALRKACGIYGILPASYTITRALRKTSERASTHGGYADIWKLTDDRNMAYAVKIIHVCDRDPLEKVRKRYCKEVIVWKRAIHVNILAIEGVAENIEFSMVSPWMNDGDLLEYVKNNPRTNRLDLLTGVTRGLDYLHRNEVVHGDLKGSNILIDREGSPLICDFGLSSITTSLESVNASTPRSNCTFRYRAPELLPVRVREGKYRRANEANEKKSNAKSTKKADVYSLSMVIVELATGEEPFPRLPDYYIIPKILKGKRPKKPSPFEAPGITLGVWKVAKKCWRHKASERPEVEQVLQDLEDVANTNSHYDRPELSLGEALCHILG